MTVCLEAGEDISGHCMTANRNPVRLRIIEMLADTEHLGAIEASILTVGGPLNPS